MFMQFKTSVTVLLIILMYKITYDSLTANNEK